ncbi:hypothetical protein D3C75_1088590 [compost metagenome]
MQSKYCSAGNFSPGKASGAYPTVSLRSYRTSVPDEIFVNPARMESSVLLPEPFLPIRAVAVPDSTSKDTSLSTGRRP